MKISDRLSDLGLVGAFFWTILAATWYLFGFWTLPPLSAVTVSAVALFAVPGLVIVFATGLFLDMFASRWFESSEIRMFAGHLKQNRKWLEVHFCSDHDYSGNALNLLVAVGEKHRRSDWVTMRGFWSPTASDEVANAYSRVLSLLISVVSIGGKGEPELLRTQISFWTAVRAIAFASLLGAVFAPASMAFFLYWVQAHPTPIDMYPYKYSVLVIVLQLVLGAWSSALVMKAYDRVCGLLFASAYVIKSENGGSLAKAAGVK